jgi:PTS system mannose-specific IIA component
VKHIFIITHGEFGKYLIKSAELILGQQKGVKAISIEPGKTPEELLNEIKTEIDKLEDSSEILFFTDIIGGTPFNSIIPFLKEENHECVTGVNLPMLLEVLTNVNNMNLKKLAVLAYNKGIEGIRNVKVLVNSMKGGEQNESYTYQDR